MVPQVANAVRISFEAETLQLGSTLVARIYISHVSQCLVDIMICKHSYFDVYL